MCREGEDFTEEGRAAIAALEASARDAGEAAQHFRYAIGCVREAEWRKFLARMHERAVSNA